MEQIFCHYLQSLQPKLLRSSYGGSLGVYLLDSISNPAWDLWKAHQIKLINELKLSLLNSKDKERLKKEMLLFLKITETFE